MWLCPHKLCSLGTKKGLGQAGRTPHPHHPWWSSGSGGWHPGPRLLARRSDGYPEVPAVQGMGTAEASILLAAHPTAWMWTAGGGCLAQRLCTTGSTHHFPGRQGQVMA